MGRATRHIILFLASSVACTAFYLVLTNENRLWRLSMATAYVSLVLLALTLMVGPWNKLRGRPNPVSGYLRRDIGIWAGMLGIVHVVLGLQMHLGGKMWLYFLPERNALTFPLRIDLFGFANYTGLVSTLILIMLLGLSNNASLRAFGASRWKSLQRWNYAGALLVVAHGVAYQILEKRTIGFLVAFAVIVVLAAAIQFAGFRLMKKET